MNSQPLPNKAYTAHVVRQNFSYAETLDMLGALYAIRKTSFGIGYHKFMLLHSFNENETSRKSRIGFRKKICIRGDLSG